MKTLIDIVNVNGEASCLASSRWLDILKGKTSSEFFQWLNLYCKHKKKITLGLTGTTVVDAIKLNPEAINLINRHPQIFEVIIRPFSHDVALLRSVTEYSGKHHIAKSSKVIVFQVALLLILM